MRSVYTKYIFVVQINPFQLSPFFPSIPVRLVAFSEIPFFVTPKQPTSRMKSSCSDKKKRKRVGKTILYSVDPSLLAWYFEKAHQPQNQQIAPEPSLSISLPPRSAFS